MTEVLTDKRPARWAIMVNADGFSQCAGCGKIWGDWHSDKQILEHPESDCLPVTHPPAVNLIVVRTAERYRDGSLSRDSVLGTSEPIVVYAQSDGHVRPSSRPRVFHSLQPPGILGKITRIDDRRKVQVENSNVFYDEHTVCILRAADLARICTITIFVTDNSEKRELHFKTDLPEEVAVGDLIALA